MKDKSMFVCQACGAQSPKWVGRCPECQEWNTLAEEVEQAPARGLSVPAAGSAAGPIPLHAVPRETATRARSGLPELDRILGGGVVPGSVTLIGGDPGIGKSTLLLQVSDAFARAGKRVLYISAEESAAQTRLRAERLGARAEGILLACESAIDRILTFVESSRPEFMIVDSIQMIHRPDLPGAPGTVTQVRGCATELVAMAKRNNIALFLIGHVTKDGALAGPRTLEHLVDTVLYFEGDRYQNLRVLRAVKNRFGSTDEVGLMEMVDEGLRPVEDPGRLVMANRHAGLSGSALFPAHVGSRVLLVEMQALTTRAVYGVPARKVSGVDGNRVALILAVLEKRAGLALGLQDVFVNAAGGVRVDEPAADLAIAVTAASSFLDQAIAPGTALVGEIGLGGEIRAVPRLRLRLDECQRLGVTRILVPSEGGRAQPGPGNLRVQSVTTLREAVDAAIQGG